MAGFNVDTDFALVIGEALIDLVVEESNADEPQAHPGGSPMNVALTLSRLGRPVELVTWFGNDDHGQLIQDHLDASNVPVSAGSRGASRTATALARVASDGSATYEFDLDWNPPAPIVIPSNAAFVETGSIGATLEPGYEAVLEAIERASTSAIIAYDPNARPTIMSSPDELLPLFEKYLALANLIKASDEDIAWLYPELSVDEVIKHWFSLGNAQLIVLTRGKSGPTAWTRAGVQVSRVPEKVNVVDTVGAGDSFMGALIDALWRRDLKFAKNAGAIGELSQAEVTSILDEANAVANVTVSRAGANPPWRHEL